MPTLSDLKQSRFISKNDLGAQQAALVTIRAYEEVNVAQDKSEPEYKYALIFDEFEKSFVLNMTNASEISEIAGSEDFDHWIGAKIVLYYDKNVMFGTKKIGGIRVRAPKLMQGAGMPPASRPMQQSRPPGPAVPRQHHPATLATPLAPGPEPNYMEAGNEYDQPSPASTGGPDSDLPF